jgi:hypothetical protein
VHDAFLVKKKALKETIDLIKEMDARRLNSVFKSRVDRFKEGLTASNSNEKDQRPIVVVQSGQADSIDKSEYSYSKKVHQSLSVVHENEPSPPPKYGFRGIEVERMKQTSPFKSMAPRFKRHNTEDDESPGPATY